MIVTVTNTSGGDLNALDSISGGVGTSALLAVGGARKDPLPYPFGHIGDLANAGTSVLPVHSADFRHGAGAGNAQMGRGLPMREGWNLLVQAGTVTFAAAAQADAVDVEDVQFGTI